jgi:uncharacterized protein (DUF2141 family)
MNRIIIFFAMMLSTPAMAATLDVTVTNVRNDHGRILVAVCSRQDFLKPHCPFAKSSPAKVGDVTVRIIVPPGIWAVQAFQDENLNGKIDRSFLGLPTEGIGFSRDAPFHWGPPNFRDAAILISNLPSRISLRLRYF